MKVWEVIAELMKAPQNAELQIWHSGDLGFSPVLHVEANESVVGLFGEKPPLLKPPVVGTRKGKP